jgi:tetratricopeptide (TPR) repeat protein
MSDAKIISIAREDLISFGDVPDATNALLQRGVLAYRKDPEAAEVLFQEALALDPAQLPVYYCLYKIYAYRGLLDNALAVATVGLNEAARQAGWSDDFRAWERAAVSSGGPEHFALYTLKALAFIHLRRGETDCAQACLDKLAELAPNREVDFTVVAALAEKVAGGA